MASSSSALTSTLFSSLLVSPKFPPLLNYQNSSSSSLLHFTQKLPSSSLISASTTTRRPFSSIIPKLSETERPVSVSEPEEEPVTTAIVEPKEYPPKAKREEIFAVVMIGGRQYIVFPGRFIYTQRLKGANVNDKIILNKVLLVGTKTSTWIGQPVVPNAVVHAVVEEQGLNDKVIVFKYKKKKNYRRNIGHRQPNTRIRITGITGHENSPFVTLDS